MAEDRPDGCVGSWRIEQPDHPQLLAQCFEPMVAEAFGFRVDHEDRGDDVVAIGGAIGRPTC